MPRDNTHSVTLPAAASQAAHEVVDDKFDFSTPNAQGPPSTVPPVDDLPGQAADHVPDNIPPQELPSEAVDNMSDIVTAQLMEHVPWLIEM